MHNGNLKTRTSTTGPKSYETIASAAERWNVNERTIRRRLESGELTGYRMGRIVRLDPNDVDAMFTRTDFWAC